MDHNTAFALENVIKVIKQSKEYQNCILLKEKMSKNDILLELIEETKKKQKQYVKENFSDEKIKMELDHLEKSLNEIPLYVEYNQNLKVVNEMINTMTESLNDYFIEIFNVLK